MPRRASWAGPGALLIGLGALASMTGNLAGQILTGSRMLYALAEQGDLPRALRDGSTRATGRR